MRPTSYVVDKLADYQWILACKLQSNVGANSNTLCAAAIKRQN
jgi:hypothetical protein